MTEIERNLRWTIQWLDLLHKGGFPTADVARMLLNDPKTNDRNVKAIAKRLVEVTPHLAHPSLTALRASLSVAENKST